VKYSPRCDFKTVSSLAFLGGIANFILVCLRLARDRLVSPTSYRLRIFSVYRQKFVAAEPRATRVSRVSRQAASPTQSVRVFSARQCRRSQSDHVADLQAAVAASSETSVCHTHTHTRPAATPRRVPGGGVPSRVTARKRPRVSRLSIKLAFFRRPPSRLRFAKLCGSLAEYAEPRLSTLVTGHLPPPRLPRCGLVAEWLACWTRAQ